MGIEAATETSPGRGTEWTRHWIDLLSAAILAGATLATAWSAYQSSLWSKKYSTHSAKALTGVVRVGKFTTLAQQRRTVHANLFVQWIVAVNNGDKRTADFLFTRFPEPLKAATLAWRGTNPEADPAAPGSPFDMPEYALAEGADAERWELTATSEATAAERAADTSNRYLLFTIIFASVLFFAGVSGKCHWNTVDVALLVLGALTLVGGVAAMIMLPRG